MITSSEVPFRQVDGRQCLTEKQIADDLQLKQFIRRYRHCFKHDPLGEIWWYDPEAGE